MLLVGLPFEAPTSGWLVGWFGEDKEGRDTKFTRGAAFG